MESFASRPIRVGTIAGKLERLAALACLLPRRPLS